MTIYWNRYSLRDKVTKTDQKVITACVFRHLMSELVKIKDSLVEAMLFFKIRKTETHQNVNTARECRLLRYNI